MNNVLYTVTSNENLTFRGVLSSDGSTITITKDDNTSAIVATSAFFGDFANDSVEIIINAKVSNADREASPSIYNVINGTNA